LAFPERENGVIKAEIAPELNSYNKFTEVPYLSLMESIDLVKINFSDGQLQVLNACLAFLMFGVALDIKGSDLKRAFTAPKAGAIGLLSQMLCLPILTMALIYLFRPPTSLALGMILIGVCPGGNVSNYAVHLARGNTALSVSLSSIITLCSIFLLPISFFFCAGLLPEGSNLPPELQVDAMDMVQALVVLLVLPLLAGMLLQQYAPEWVEKIKRPVGTLSMVIFGSFVVFAAAGNWDNILTHLRKVFVLVFVHNGLALAMGYFLAKAGRLSESDARAISLETGIQNSGFGLILIFSFFGGNGGMAMITAWWGIWHLISAFSLAMFWRWRDKMAGITQKNKVII
jgi:BASS family bile acid:Na+ symporter